MRFGVFWQTPGTEGSSLARRHWETIEEIALADELGFETAWLAESVFDTSRPMSNPLMVAASAAQRTRRIRFGPLAIQTPLHHPLQLAMQSATCDILTDGRLDMCLGGRYGGSLGARTGRSLGVPVDVSMEESRERIAEAIQLLKLAWTQETATFHGRFWSVDAVSVLPRPVQRPHPPLLLAANSNDSFTYAAAQGLGAICTTLAQPVPSLMERLAEFDAAKLTSGASHPQQVHVMVSFFVAESKAEAQELAGRNWSDSDATAGVDYLRSLGFDTSNPESVPGAIGWMMWDLDRVLEVCIYDEPAACVEGLQRLREQLPSMGMCILEFNRRGRIPSERVMQSMRLFAEKVMPELDCD